MPGATDLDALLRSLTIERRPGVFGYAVLPPGAEPLSFRPDAIVEEAEGTTVVAPIEALAAAGLEPVFVAAWLSLTVHSSLEAIGLTAVLSARLAAAGIPANVIAGTFHDHVLVPVADADRAAAALVGR